jgi:hypothetical protein
VSVRIYVEGAGDYKHTDNATACRRGFRELFEKLGLPERRLSVIACGSRLQTFNDFRKAVRQQSDDFIILLVDSEGAVETQSVWGHLHTRDGWQPPAGTIEDQGHLMVQCMEAWFLADQEALIGFYGQGFLAGSLPGQPNIEQLQKRTLLPILKHASKQTMKGSYDKTRHAFALLALIDPSRLRVASLHAARLFDVLIQRTSHEPAVGH